MTLHVFLRDFWSVLLVAMVEIIPYPGFEKGHSRISEMAIGGSRKQIMSWEISISLISETRKRISGRKIWRTRRRTSLFLKEYIREMKWSCYEISLAGLQCKKVYVSRFLCISVWEYNFLLASQFSWPKWPLLLLFGVASSVFSLLPLSPFWGRGEAKKEEEMNPEWRLGVSQSEGPWNGIRQLSCCCCLFFWRKKIKMQHLMYHFWTGKWANSIPLSVLVGSPSCLVRACPRGETTLQSNQQPTKPKNRIYYPAFIRLPSFLPPSELGFSRTTGKDEKIRHLGDELELQWPPPRLHLTGGQNEP